MIADQETKSEPGLSGWRLPVGATLLVIGAGWDGLLVPFVCLVAVAVLVLPRRRWR